LALVQPQIFQPHNLENKILKLSRRVESGLAGVFRGLLVYNLPHPVPGPGVHQTEMGETP
jgi:hypothetical protein